MFEASRNEHLFHKNPFASQAFSWEGYRYFLCVRPPPRPEMQTKFSQNTVCFVFIILGDTPFRNIFTFLTISPPLPREIVFCEMNRCLSQGNGTKTQEKIVFVGGTTESDRFCLWYFIPPTASMFHAMSMARPSCGCSQRHTYIFFP